MLNPNSPLIQIPAQLDRKQAIFLDGIRYAAEMMGFSYGRLQQTLTEIARLHREEKPPHQLFTPAFIDAWVIIDTIDRFRGLLRNINGVTHTKNPNGSPGFFDTTEPVRKLRNVADHIYSRVEKVIASRSTALGTLSWFTLDDDKTGGISYLLVPGTVQQTMSGFINPLGRPMELPTELITLEAEGQSVCLSDMVRETLQAVEKLEVLLDHGFREMNIRDNYAASDIVFAAELKFDSSPDEGKAQH